MEVSLEFTSDSKEKEEVVKCLRILYATPIGSVALDRDFGMDWSFLDLPLPTARARIESELIRKTQKYEPRVRVQEVVWGFSEKDGQMKAKVVVEFV